MRYDEAVVEIVQGNGPEQHYATCTAVLGLEPEHRLTTDGLGRMELWERARGYQVFGVKRAGGKAFVTLGPNLVLRPTPEYARMTQVGVEEPYVWRFDEDDLVDQLDDICTGERLRLIAARRPDGKWSAFFSDQQDVPREQRRRSATFAADTLQAALWGAVRAFRQGVSQMEEEEPKSEPARAGATRETRLEARLRCLIAGVEMLFESAELDDGMHVIVRTARLDALRGAARRTRHDLEGGTI